CVTVHERSGLVLYALFEMEEGCCAFDPFDICGVVNDCRGRYVREDRGSEFGGELPADGIVS
ncbi:MAG: hypothetical protein Q9215_005815, partial [Flavoplaca cf. flavocitrina]